MSQILLARDNAFRSLLFQDLYFVQRRALVQTTVREVTCVICGKGLDEGISVTVKPIGQKMRLFCQFHIPQE